MPTKIESVVYRASSRDGNFCELPDREFSTATQSSASRRAHWIVASEAILCSLLM